MPAKRTPKSKPYKAIAEYYDPEHEDVEQLKRDVPFLLAKIPPRRKILELACGTARASIPLAESGHRVAGVDFDPDMLAVARRKRDFVGLTDRQLRLARADISRLDLNETFDWCVVLFNSLLSFSTLGELDAVLEGARRHLKPRGTFYLDLFNPNLTLIAEGESCGLDPVTFHVPSLGRTVSRLADIVDTGRQTRRVTFHYRWFLDGEQQNEQVTFDVTWIMPREMQLLLERHGFKVLNQWGDYDGSPVERDSPRMITLAKKR